VRKLPIAIFKIHTKIPMKSVRIFPRPENMAQAIARSWCKQAQRAAENHRVF
jgi:hypothetical protein